MIEKSHSMSACEAPILSVAIAPGPENKTIIEIVESELKGIEQMAKGMQLSISDLLEIAHVFRGLQNEDEWNAHIDTDLSSRLPQMITTMRSLSERITDGANHLSMLLPKSEVVAISTNDSSEDCPPSVQSASNPKNNPPGFLPDQCVEVGGEVELNIPDSILRQAVVISRDEAVRISGGEVAYEARKRAMRMGVDAMKASHSKSKISRSGHGSKKSTWIS